MNSPFEKISMVDLIVLFALIFTAATIRVSFHTGYMGSDEVVYTNSAFKLLEGDWTVSNYVGANRYGVNLPVAGFAYLFGKTEFSASLYSHLCSLLEISLIFIFGRLMFGLRTAVIAALILIFLPIHAHYAGRLLADAPLALMITASFLFFWYGEIKNNPISFFIAGLAAGLSFWIKPHAIIYLFVFALYPLIFFRWNWRWTWMALGLCLCIVTNSLLFWLLIDDPMFILKLFYNRPDGDVIAATFENRETSPFFYLNYLFIKIYHTWLLAYMAAAGCLIWFIQRQKTSLDENFSVKFIMLWFLGLVAVLSLFIVSWSPLVFISKQPNYMLIFVAPGALLAGYAVSKLRGRMLALALGVIIIPSIMLVILHQNHLHVFTANSKAAVNFARQNTEAEIFSHTNPSRAPRYFNLYVDKSKKINIQPLGKLIETRKTYQKMQEKNPVRYVVIDVETLSWQANNDQFIHNMSDVPTCWIEVEKLQPLGLGNGWKILKFAGDMARLLPTPVSKKISQIIDGQTIPKPAYVYKIPDDCVWE